MDRRLCIGAGVSYSFFVLVIMALHVIRFDASTTRYLSEYAVGPYGIWMASALVVSGVGSMGLAIVMGRQLGPCPFAWLTAGLILLGGLTTCLLAVYPTDLGPAAAAGGVTMNGILHSVVANLRVLAGLFAATTWPLAVRHHPRWQHLRPVALATGALTLGSFAMMVWLPSAYVGLGQRVWVGVNIGWALSVIRTLGEWPPNFDRPVRG